jgi:hypothetical protein
MSFYCLETLTANIETLLNTNEEEDLEIMAKKN